MVRGGWRSVVALCALGGCVLGGCVPDGGGGDDPPDARPDLEPAIIIDQMVELPDVGFDAAPDAAPDGGADSTPGDADVTGDFLPPDMAPEPDAAPLGIESCEAACGRYAACDELADRFGDLDACLRHCERVSRLGPPEEWWGCVELETCNLLRLCPVPPIEPLPCAEVCDLVGECGVDDPRGDCVDTCEEFGDPFRACGDVLFGGVCDGDGFRRCAVDVTFPQCGATCLAGVACNLVREGECLDRCFDPDPLAQRSRRRVNACAAGAGDDCLRLDACFVDQPDPIGVCAGLCEAKQLCGLDLGIDSIACIQACSSGEQAPGGPDYAAEGACANSPSCPEFAVCLDAAGARVGPCFAWCQATTTCDPEADQGRQACMTECVSGFGDEDTLRFGAAAPCLADAGPGADCDALTACIPQGEPMVDCEGVCGALDRCRVPAEGCRAGCAEAPDRPLAICLADTQRAGDGCGGVAACADYAPPAPPAACEALCDVVTPCDGEVDPYLCRLDCTPLPPEVPAQLACAEFAGCADLPACLALDGVANPTCVDLCPGAVACGLYPDVAACEARCTGLAASPRTPADFLQRAGDCLTAAGAPAACDPVAAANCFAPASCDLRDDLIYFNGNQGRVNTDTRGLPDAYDSPCAGGGAAEAIIVINVAGPANLRAFIFDADYDTALNLFSPCDGPNIACNDDDFNLPDGLWSSIEVAVDAGTYYLMVEGFNGGTGTATVDITITPR